MLNGTELFLGETTCTWPIILIELEIRELEKVSILLIFILINEQSLSFNERIAD